MSSIARVSPASIWLFVLLCFGFTNQLTAEELTIAENAESIQPVTVGDKMPSFTVKNSDGDDVDFSAAELEQPLVLVTYRGGWCPYCNVQLQGLRKVLPDINALGAEVIFLTGDAPEDIFQSLKEKTREEIKGLDYKIYSDAELNAASQLGVAFYLEPGLAEKLDEYGLAKRSSVERHNALPVPSVFIVDKTGDVRYRFFDPDYKVRLDATELLEVVRNELAKK